MTQENTCPEPPEDKRDCQVYKRVPVVSLKTFPQTRGIAFEDLDIADLETSVRQHGIHQPLLVCHIEGESGKYAVICGHRRLKAAIACRFKQVPVMIRKDVVHGRAECRQTIDTLQIEENLQRQDLSPLQEALVTKAYKNRYGLSNSALSRGLGISRSTLVNTLKIAALYESLQKQGLPSMRLGDK